MLSTRLFGIALATMLALGCASRQRDPGMPGPPSPALTGQAEREPGTVGNQQPRDDGTIVIALGTIGPFENESGHTVSFDMPAALAPATLRLAEDGSHGALILSDGSTHAVTLAFSDDKRQFVVRTTVDQIQMGWAIDTTRPAVAILLVNSAKHGIIRAQQAIRSMSVPPDAPGSPIGAHSQGGHYPGCRWMIQPSIATGSEVPA